METKFKKGQEVYYVMYLTPSKGTIDGTCIIDGKFKTEAFNMDSKISETYYMISIFLVPESQVFANIEEVKNYLTRDL